MKCVAQARQPHFIPYIASVAQPKSYLEVGVQDGNSVMAMLRGWPEVEKLILCDNWGFIHGGTGRGSHDFVAGRLKPIYSGEVQFLDGDSRDTIPTIPLMSVDMSHVDADHSRDGELSDLRLTWPRTNKVMVVHDIFFPEVWDAVSTFVQESLKQIDFTELAFGDTGTIAIWRA